MTIEDVWRIAPGILGVISVIGGFIYWHFKTINSFKDDIHKVELKLKGLEQSDKLQQQTIDKLGEIYPMLKIIIEKVNIKK